MKRATREWVDKAEGDWQVTGREGQATSPVWDAVCFHAQQCAEKYLKALLEEEGTSFARTHDLVYLLRQMRQRIAALDVLEPELAYLSPLAVAARYPGMTASAVVAARASDIAGKVRTTVRSNLGLP
jgi:HEPN domain-containing protein